MNQQQEMLLGPYEVKEMRDIPEHLVALCRDYIDAVNLCMNESRTKRTRRTWAEHMGMHEASLSLILNKGGSEGRKRNLDPNLFDAIQRLSGNRAISQFFYLQSRGLLNHQSTTMRIRQLEEELAQLRGVA